MQGVHAPAVALLRTQPASLLGVRPVTARTGLLAGKLTRQGVRDLNDIGQAPRRGHVGRAKEVDQRRCAHLWQLSECDHGCFIYGTCTHAVWHCTQCGAIR
jgi:hypothetical protein